MLGSTKHYSNLRTLTTFHFILLLVHLNRSHRKLGSVTYLWHAVSVWEERVGIPSVGKTVV